MRRGLSRPIRPAGKRYCRRCPRRPGKRPLPQARGTCRSGSRPRPPPWAARAGPHRPAEPPGAPGVVLIPAIGQHSPDVGVNDDHELARPRAEARTSSSPARSDTAVLRRYCSLGYERAWDLTDCPGIPGPAGRVSRERRWLSCPCPLPAAVRAHRRAHDSCELFSNNTI